MRNRNLLLYTFAALLSVTAYAQDKDNELKPYVTRTFTDANLSEVNVETSGGSIAVTGGQSSEVKVEMYVRPNNWNGKELSKEETESRLDDYDIVIKTEGSKVIATAKRKAGIDWDNKRSVSIGFKVYSPRKMNTKLRTSGGSIKIASLTGDQDFKTSGGSLKIDDLKGNVNGATSGGSIDVANSSEQINLSTSGGSIKANSLKGNIRLNTSGGSLNLENLDGVVDAHTSGGSVKGDNITGKITAGTSGGSVRLANISGSLEASTSAGGIDVSVTKLGEYLRLSTSAGSVRVNMPLDKGADLNLRGNKVAIQLKNFDGEAENDRVRGKINGGGIPVVLTASSGNVYVNQ